MMHAASKLHVSLMYRVITSHIHAIRLILSCDRELLQKVCQIANVLKSRGVMKRDMVAIYMPACPLAVVSMLACARIGAVHR